MEWFLPGWNGKWRKENSVTDRLNDIKSLLTRQGSLLVYEHQLIYTACH
jgi:hypothetical protein